MKAKDMIQIIFDVITEVTNIKEEDIKGKSKKEDIVLARKLFVNVCINYGFSTTTIANGLGYTARGVRNLYTMSIKEDCRFLYGKYKDEIRNILGTRLSEELN